MRLLPAGVRIERGEAHVLDEEILRLSEAEMRQRRGRDMAMIFQEPATSLNPVLTIGQQIGESLQTHLGERGQRLREHAAELLAQVGIIDPLRRLSEYPFQLSGGMKQRVMIAIALASSPRLLIADEPTTALDVTVQSQILDLLQKLQAERGMSLLLITHDLGVVARMADRVGVMYAGQLVECAARADFFSAPRHPYSRALFAALPETARAGERLAALPGQVPAFSAMPSGCRFAGRCGSGDRLQVADDRKRCLEEAPLLEERGDGVWVRCHFQGTGDRCQVADNTRRDAPQDELTPDTCPLPPELAVRGLKIHFPIRKGILQRVVGHVRAVDGISLALTPGRTLALVGESGCGKTTVGRALMRMLPITEGDLFWQGQAVVARDKAQEKILRQSLQMVFQDPYGSLNPRMSVGEILLEGMLALGAVRKAQEGRERAATLLEQVGLKPESLDRYPHEFSGGQRQRIAIARALAVSPRVIICDEPTSALDVSVQAQILNLMKDLQSGLNLAYLFITHNFAVVEYLAEEIAVMYLGRIVESGTTAAVLTAPAHPYTQALLSAVPRIEGGREIIRLAGETPSPAHPPVGCHFHPRCPQATPECRQSYPPSTSVGEGHRVNCFLYQGAKV
ncbi:ABC transporter ATP-binding protein [Betaproteobacteria bacterium]|nr:ABC transporter ATP-binding protein [Betaproteobacteria bacterium]